MDLRGAVWVFLNNGKVWVFCIAGTYWKFMDLRGAAILLHVVRCSTSSLFGIHSLKSVAIRSRPWIFKCMYMHRLHAWRYLERSWVWGFIDLDGCLYQNMKAWHPSLCMKRLLLFWPLAT
ncbi:hypothetical protein VNO77_08084 [Canavalia gladiata]|uniref:Uncharacterized protein n=1 Tax=Canavalia gladiata TaxID=3824 RepID=A0AAN9M8Y9_CANGL